MKNTPILLAISAMILASLACGYNFNIELPTSKITPGPTETFDINLPLPKNAEQLTRLKLTFAAGDLFLSSGAKDALIQGTATYNVSSLKPIIDEQDDQIHIKTGDLEIDGIPNFQDNYRNKWDLQIGGSPIELEIMAGAYKGDLDLGGLALHSLEITDGASDVNLTFSSPSLMDMSIFKYKTGASNVHLEQLANARFNTMIFKGGAGSYKLDFSGSLLQDTTVVIDAGMSNLIIIVPEGTPTRIFYDGGLSNVDVSGSWQKSGNDFTLEGSGPTLTININLGVGNLTLRND
jgi:hypothetical protein